MLGAMQTRAELYDLIGYSDYEGLDSSLKKTIITDAMREIVRK
jgi:methylisocitrate lyase